MGISLVADDGVAIVEMDHSPVNALTLALYQDLAAVFQSLATRNDVNCVILRSACEKAFCAGKDLNEFLEARLEDDPAAAAIVRASFEAVRHCPVPVVAEVGGAALGAGCVIAACADIRVASERAIFGLPELNVGRCGGAAHVGRLIPQGALRLMYFTSTPVSAEEAYRLGLVDRLVVHDELKHSAASLAAAISKKSPIALRVGKQSMNDVESLPVDAGYAREQRYSTQLMKTNDAREALRAIVEKRAPKFSGD